MTVSDYERRSTIEHAERVRTEPTKTIQRSASMPPWLSYPRRRVWGEDDATTHDPDHMTISRAVAILYPLYTYQELVECANLTGTVVDNGEGNVDYLIVGIADHTGKTHRVLLSVGYPGDDAIYELETP